jgi:hypothetical protein
MKRRFDISLRPQIESGEYKVVTKSGHEVRIVCWDMNTSNGALIVALVKCPGGGFERMRSYTLDGKCKDASKKSSLFVITPEQDPTEFELAVLRCIEEYDPEVMSSKGMLEKAKEEAKILLDLARKELYTSSQEWSIEDENLVKDIIARLRTHADVSQTEFDNYYHLLRSLKNRVQPKVELTQLDKNILEAAIAFVEQNNHFNNWGGVDKHTVLSALHSLRPQNTWKPSKEQLIELRQVISGCAYDIEPLVELETKLKEL